MLTIGITGGIGSGKTTVCAVFARLGVPVLSADEIGRELGDSDPAIRIQLTKILGSSAYTSDGRLDRPFVASRLFSDARIRRRVENVIHPRVEEEIDRRLDELRRDGHKLALVEAALIYEAGLQKKLDAVIVVDSDEAVRIRRVRERDGSSEDDVRKRAAAQMSPAKKILKADYVIKNNNSLRTLETNVQFLYSILSALANGNRSEQSNL
jgi:dephospho-CoA kinase